MAGPEAYFEPILHVTHRQILEDVAQVHALARVIRGIPIPPYVQQRLDRLNILRAVRGTTGIEGTELSEEEVGLVSVTVGRYRPPPTGNENPASDG